MATGDQINCRQYVSYIDTQLPYFDPEIVKDIRPADGLVGYYETGSFEAQTGTEHTYDRFRSVFPNLTTVWNPVSTDGCNSACDCIENKIGWGWSRFTYKLMKQCWGTDLLCFDEIMTKTKAKEHLAFVISDILRPATSLIMTDFPLANAFEQAETKVVVTTGLPSFTITWDAGGYVYLNTGGVDPTGILTPQILQSFVKKQYFLGAIKASEKGYDHLELHTDVDTYRNLCKDDPYLKSSYRFGEFPCDQENYYKYGLSGWVGDYYVRTDQFPWRFVKVSAGRYQRVMPYKNVATTEGIRSVYNEDYGKAIYQPSLINNRRAMRVLPFRPEAVNPNMPFAVRDYGGKWGFATHDLGADCNGKPIDNTRGNKGKFFADFQLAVKPEHPEWMVAILHKVQAPCIVIIDTCNPDPGALTQDYNSAAPVCPTIITFTPTKKASDGSYQILANTARCNDVTLTHAAVGSAATTTIDLLVTAMN